MREIKFRAWDKLTKQMSPEFVLFGEFMLIGGVHAWQHEEAINAGLKWDRTDVHDSLIRLNDLEIMQYTGLNDKNGKEIYEGDILRMEEATAKVVFWERPPEFGLDYYHNEDLWIEDWNLCDDSERMEIIGNIYENPELCA